MSLDFKCIVCIPLIRIPYTDMQMTEVSEFTLFTSNPIREPERQFFAAVLAARANTNKCFNMLTAQLSPADLARFLDPASDLNDECINAMMEFLNGVYPLVACLPSHVWASTDLNVLLTAYDAVAKRKGLTWENLSVIVIPFVENDHWRMFSFDVKAWKGVIYDSLAADGDDYKAAIRPSLKRARDMMYTLLPHIAGKEMNVSVGPDGNKVSWTMTNPSVCPRQPENSRQCGIMTILYAEAACLKTPPYKFIKMENDCASDSYLMKMRARAVQIVYNKACSNGKTVKDKVFHFE